MGDVQVGLFFIVPFVIVSGPLAGLAIVFIFLGFATYPLLTFDRVVAYHPHPDSRTIHTSENSPGQPDQSARTGERPSDSPANDPSSERFLNKRSRGGGLIFIGPIPIVFGDKQSMKYLLPISIIILLLMIAAMFLP